MGQKPNLPSYNLLNKTTAKPQKISQEWISSYHVKGVALGLAAAGLYCYLYLGYWSEWLFILCGILGYFLGTVVGYFMQRVK
jgi:hypothetical protein